VRRLPAILVVLAVAAFLLYSSIFVVNAREQALVLRFGEIRRVITEPGIYFKVPTNFIDTVQIIDSWLLSFDIDDIRVQVRDGRRYIVDAYVAYRITDPRAFRESVSGSIQSAQDRLSTVLDASLRRVYGQRSFEAALSEQRAQMMTEVRDQLRPFAAQLGIDIADVRIKRTELLPEVSQQTFERMKAERLAEAAEIRARGTEEKLRIQAEADREAVITVSEANREAEILRGEGDGERNRIFAEAFQRDPGFFEFYRSMLAYRQAMQGDNTTLVLTPESDFLKYFQEEVPGAPAPTPPAGGAAAPAPVPQAAVPAAPAAAAPAAAAPAPTNGAAAAAGPAVPAPPLATAVEVPVQAVPPPAAPAAAPAPRAAAPVAPAPTVQ